MPVDRDRSAQFGWMDRDLLTALDAAADERGSSRRQLTEALLTRALSCELVELSVPGQAARVAVASELLNISVEGFVARACSSLLERVDSGWRGPVDVPRFSQKGFEGSKLPGHADVPELGWYRPSSEEAKRGVEITPVDVDKLPSGVRRGG